MIVSGTGVRVILPAEHGHAERDRRSVGLGVGCSEAMAFEWGSVCVPGAQGRPAQTVVLGWSSLLQVAGARLLSLAIGQKWQCAPDICPVGDVVGRH